MTLIDLFRKYKYFIAYVFFGILTTIINLLCYRFFYIVFKLPNVPSTILAWLFAVLFAFITNKLWVFESKSLDLKVTLAELFKFLLCRITTGVLDVFIMWLMVDKLNQNAMIWKLLSNVIVIILNYVASKLFVFMKKEKI